MSQDNPLKTRRSTMAARRATETARQLAILEEDVRAFGRDRIVYDKNTPPHPLTLHPLIDPASLRAVLDVGAGTCAWIGDVARLVHGLRETTGNNRTVSMRGADPEPGAYVEPGADGTNGDALNSNDDALSSSGDAPPALFACDITAAKFPPQETLQALGIRAFEHDIRTALPGGMGGFFSLISIRLVLVWLTVDEIRAALQNVKEALGEWWFLSGFATGKGACEAF
ncbi:hypothetical protein EV715DRAFT_297322 [Schizophyllum commune]